MRKETRLVEPCRPTLRRRSGDSQAHGLVAAVLLYVLVGDFNFPGENQVLLGNYYDFGHGEKRGKNRLPDKEYRSKTGPETRFLTCQTTFIIGWARPYFISLKQILMALGSGRLSSSTRCLAVKPS